MSKRPPPAPEESTARKVLVLLGLFAGTTVLGFGINWLLDRNAQPVPRLPAPVAAASPSPPNCRFVLGFKTVRDLTGGKVGECLENQRLLPNGDVEQKTTTGLLARRKSSGVSYFTDGYRTLALGPGGIQTRLNSDPAFDWEASAATAAAGGQVPQGSWVVLAGGLPADGAAGHFKYPFNATVDAAGNLYVSDTGNDRIYKLSPAGTPIATWGGAGAGPAQFQSPRGLAVDGKGQVYVADQKNRRVDVLSPAGSFLSSLGAGDSVPMDSPVDVALAPDGRVYVADNGKNEIRVFSSTGAARDTWKSATGSTPFNKPTGLALDAENQILYVADLGNRRVQALSLDGQLLAEWGADYFTSPAGLAVDPRGNVYVTDVVTGQINMLSPAGMLVARTGKPGAAIGEFNFPVGVVADRQGNIYVNDVNNNRIQKFQP